MDQDRLKDWTFRYQSIYPVRRTNKQKQRFLSALAADIVKMRQDISIIEYKQDKKYVSSNLYVGDIEQADQIICTYYDTPPQSIGAYELFNREKQRQSTMAFILVSVTLSLLIGLGGTWLYMSNSHQAFELSSISTFVAMVGYGLYFYLLSKVAKGLSTRRTLVRNTSSILALLCLMAQVDHPKIAYAFIDEGCFGERGLEALKLSCKKSAQIYLLDCVGAETPLHVRGPALPKELAEINVHHSKGPITSIFGAKVRTTTQGNQYYLEPTDLKKMSTDNLATLIKLFT